MINPLALMMARPVAAAGYSADLCTGGTVLGNSEYVPYYRTQAFDNNESTMWASFETGASGTTYIGYHFASAHDVTQFRIKNGYSGAGYGMTSVKLQYSDDGSSWTDVATISLTDDAGANWQTKNGFSTGSHEYVRLLANANIAGNWCAYEIEMMENA